MTSRFPQAFLWNAFFLLVCMPTAWAHHGFNGRYDLSKPVWIEGVVTKAYFGQPHAELSIRTAASLAVPSPLPDLAESSSFLSAGSLVVIQELRGQVVRVELPPTGQFFSLERRIKVGDRVAVIAVRNCESPFQLNGQWVKAGNGAPVARSGSMSYMVKGC